MQALVPASPVSGYTGKGVARWFIQTKATNNSCEMLKICNSTCWWKNVFFPPVWAFVPQSFEVQGGIWHYAGIGWIRPVLQGLLQFPQDQCWKRQTLISNKFYISGEMMCVTQVENERRTNAPRLVNTLLWAWFPGPTQDLQGGMKLIYKGNEFQISMTNIGVEIRIQDQSEGIPR